MPDIDVSEMHKFALIQGRNRRVLFDAICNLLSLAYDTSSLLAASIPLSVAAIASFQTSQGHLAMPGCRKRCGGGVIQVAPSGATEVSSRCRPLTALTPVSI